MAHLVPGFDPGDAADDGVDQTVTRRLVADQNRRKSKSGGFQKMGFSAAVLNGIVKRGYRVPTPIQRRCIPLILDGRDVVAMARTGSGKTACFLLPLLERLQCSAEAAGVRALVLSPTRELALQTLRFARQLGRFCQLRVAAVLGGEAMDEQFSAVHARPDVLVATPGRLVHLCLEMRLRLSAVRYVVLDEADRLFELGLGEQVREILARLPDSRQTLLFSATLPAALAEFARAGLNEPALVRLDTEQQLSPLLKLVHLRCRVEERASLLLLLLQQLSSAGPAKTLVFVPTRHHVEHVRQLLQHANVVCTHLYSSMDPEARRCHAERFRATGSSGVDVMIVTDVAARGIDIPHLDNVINYNFPARPKLFVHRVGRVARAGRSGTAYSLIAPSELPFLLDLYLFLGQPLLTCSSSGADCEGSGGRLGVAPQQLVDCQLEQVRSWHEQSVELMTAQTTSQNAHKHYVRTRPPASRESVRRAKQLHSEPLSPHPIFNTDAGTGGESHPFTELLGALRSYKSSKTIFEVGARRGQQSEAARVMMAKRKRDAPVLQRAAQNALQRDALRSAKQRDATSKSGGEESGVDLLEDLQERDAKKRGSVKSNSSTTQFRDNTNYIPRVSERHHAEAGYSVSENFNKHSGELVLDLSTDNSEQMKSGSFNRKHWDLSKRRYVGESNDGKNKKVKTESGVWVPASFQRSGRYDQWKKKNRIEACENGNLDDDDASGAQQSGKGVKVLGLRCRDRFSSKSVECEVAGSRPVRSELLSNDQILKHREAAERRRRRSTVGVAKRGSRSERRGGKRGFDARGGKRSSRTDGSGGKRGFRAGGRGGRRGLSQRGKTASNRTVPAMHAKGRNFASRGGKAVRGRRR